MYGKVFSLVAVSFLTSVAMAGPTLIDVPLDKAFVPVGFDDNDVVQVVVAGQFPDTCHKLGPTRVRVDEVRRLVWLEQSAYRYTDICLRVIVPFTQVVNIGIVRAGDYTLVDEMSKAGLGTLPITVAKSESPDDYLYAPVSDADIVPGTNPGKQKLVLRGTLTDRCTIFHEIRVNYYNDVVVVQPIIKYIPEGRCGFTRTRYEKTVELDRHLTGTYLLHVRAMSGGSINKVLDLP